MDTKRCRDCLAVKELAEFYANKRYKSDGRDIICKDCRKAANALYRENNKEHVNSVQREWSRKRYGWNPAKQGLTARARVLKKYGLTVEDYDSMYELQNGCCQICMKPFDTLVVDHCHDTGKVRGLLCRACNRGIGMFGDNAETVMAAHKYLMI